MTILRSNLCNVTVLMSNNMKYNLALTIFNPVLCTQLSPEIDDNCCD